MSKELAAKCGIYCGECDYKDKFNCPGCQQSEGKMFWGDCQVSRCAIDKGVEHCGGCKDFACDVLKTFSYDKEQGDHGQRIKNIEGWNQLGFENWLKTRG